MCELWKGFDKPEVEDAEEGFLKKGLTMACFPFSLLYPEESKCALVAMWGVVSTPRKMREYDAVSGFGDIGIAAGKINGFLTNKTHLVPKRNLTYLIHINTPPISTITRS